MPKNMLIRDVPNGLHTWVQQERTRQLMTQKDFVISVLNEAAQAYRVPSLFEDVPAPLPAGVKIPFTFADVFAGIGGFRFALEPLGGRCVFSSEWDKYAQKTYRAWFQEVPRGDIRKVKPIDIPDHDVLAAGFPCQPFSLAGVSKKKSLGRPHGFGDATQGTLFFQLATIIQLKRPPVLFLENVKNLCSHESGRTWDVIRSTLSDELDYVVRHKIIDAVDYVPQHRERVFHLLATPT